MARQAGEEPPEAYAGRWVARVGDRLVGQGGTPQQALSAARAANFKEKPAISYVPTQSPLVFPEIVERVRSALPTDQPVYLAGGAVRDALLGRETHDLDFILPAGALRAARRVAVALSGAYFPLDEERQAGRVILTDPHGKRLLLDFAALRGANLEADLRGRDFTVDAMAVELSQPLALLDPLGGAADLLARRLRACSSASMVEDPVRVMRGVRLAAAYNLHIEPETRRWMRQAAPALGGVSAERLRDELFRILGGPQPATVLYALDMLGGLAIVFPELAQLKNVAQSEPHRVDAFTHTLDVVRKIELVLSALSPRFEEGSVSNLALGLLSLRLGRYREVLGEYLGRALSDERSLRQLLFLAALMHDVGKATTASRELGGRIRFIGHEGEGEKIAAERARQLRLSNPEVERVQRIVRHHMRPLLLRQADERPSRKAIYRFFRDCGESGVEVCLLSLADVLATHAASLPQDEWGAHLEVVRDLLAAWWENSAEAVDPPALVDGHVLMEALDLPPGPLVGRLIELIREAQAEGRVTDFQQALDLARRFMESGNHLPDEPQG